MDIIKPTLHPPQKLRQYPHMMPQDIPVWERFLDRYGTEWNNFQYDVHVGEGIRLNPSWDDATKRMAMRLTQKRIDVVGHKQDELFIIEVKTRVTPAALGQVLTYVDLYKKTFRPEKPILPLIVAETIMSDIHEVAKSLSIPITTI